MFVKRILLCWRPIFMAVLCCLPAVAGRPAQAQNTLVIDDFESGIADWTRNDQIKSDNPAAEVLLVDIVATRPRAGGLAGSQGAGLFAFKTAKKAWASASRRVDGRQWAKIGAQRLTFWLNANGEEQGVDLVLRGRFKAANGQMRDEAFRLPMPVKLSFSRWRKVVIPLSDFKSLNGPLPPRLNGVYLLQFVQTGTWDSRFFTVDQLQIEGDGQPIAQQPLTPSATPAPTTAAANSAQVSVDYLRSQGRIRAGANVSIGALMPGSEGAINLPLETNAQFRFALQTLRPAFIRLEAGALVDLVDSSRPAFDFSRLQVAVNRVRGLNAEPLIALNNPSTWGLDEGGYAQFAAQAARALNRRGVAPVRFWELALGQASDDALPGDAAVVALYNRARAVLKGVSSSLRVGGIAASAGRAGTLDALLRGARGLDFLSLQFFGARAGQPADATLFAYGRDVTALRLAAQALARSRWKNAALYVTQSNLNAARSDGENAPADGRMVRMTAAAWWATYLSSAAPLVNQVFHNDAINPEWGLLDENARAYPAYYTLWMWNTYFPAGSTRVEAKVSRRDIVAVAANTATAHNLLLANTGDRDISVRVAIRGFPILRAATLRILEDPTGVPPPLNLPKSPFQTITLKPYAVAVLQFTEPPRRS